MLDVPDIDFLHAVNESAEKADIVPVNFKKRRRPMGRIFFLFLIISIVINSNTLFRSLYVVRVPQHKWLKKALRDKDFHKHHNQYTSLDQL